MQHTPKSLGNFLDLGSAEREYPLSRRTLNALISAGRLRAYRVDGKIIVKRTDLEAFFTARRIVVEPRKEEARRE